MGVQLCYEANGDKFFLDYPATEVISQIYLRFPKSAAMLFGSETETEEVFSIRCHLLLEAVNEIVSGIHLKGLTVSSTQIIHEWSGHPCVCKATGLFKLPDKAGWYSLKSDHYNYPNKCIMTEYEEIGGKIIKKAEIDVSELSEIKTATAGYGTLKIRRKQRRIKSLRDLERLREFLNSVGEALVSVALC